MKLSLVIQSEPTGLDSLNSDRPVEAERSYISTRAFASLVEFAFDRVNECKKIPISMLALSKIATKGVRKQKADRQDAQHILKLMVKDDALGLFLTLAIPF